MIKLKNEPSNLSNLKSKVDKLDVDKLLPVPIDLRNDVVKNDVVKKDVYNAKIKSIEDKIPDITNVATNTTLILLKKVWLKMKQIVLLT